VAAIDKLGASSPIALRAQIAQVPDTLDEFTAACALEGA
jgi:hypothetical protein